MTRDLFRFGDLLLLGRASNGLPPGQREISAFPRFGGSAFFDLRPPPSPSIEIRGAGIETGRIDAEALSRLPRGEVVADFHCVAGWSARGLRWEGVRLRDLLETLAPAPDVTHLRAVGRDGFRAALLLEDALADDVLIADRLDGEPLPMEHGGPWRLVCPSQYGYKSVKHLRRLELRSGEPADRDRRSVSGLTLRALGEHPRGRVWEEESHRCVAARSVRWAYGSLAHPVFYSLGYLGALRTRGR